MRSATGIFRRGKRFSRSAALSAGSAAGPGVYRAQRCSTTSALGGGAVRELSIDAAGRPGERWLTGPRRNGRVRRIAGSVGSVGARPSRRGMPRFGALEEAM
ncbi:hypothetical protein GCM10023222_45850 [Saccharopolyspora cebuensis]